LETLEEPLQTDSLRKRLDELWVNAFHDFAESPVIGHGPAKASYTGIITDSEYLDVLKQVGIVGLFAYLAYFLYPLWLIGKGLSVVRPASSFFETYFPANLLTLRFALIMLILALVMNVGESTLHNLILQSFVWIWAGLAGRSAVLFGQVAKRLPPSMYSDRARPF
jgi:O-antigen ligase